MCSGPGFLVNFIGAQLYSSIEVGLIIFAAQCISVFILGFALKFVCRNKLDNNSNSETLISTPQKGDALVKSVLDGARGMFAICAFVVLFSAFTEIFCSHITDENIQKPFLIPWKFAMRLLRYRKICRLNLLHFRQDSADFAYIFRFSRHLEILR